MQEPKPSISVGSYVLVDGNPTKRALVECNGNAADTWDIYYEDEGVEEDGVPASRLQLDRNQPKKATDDELLATVAFLIQQRKGKLDTPDEMWRLPPGTASPEALATESRAAAAAAETTGTAAAAAASGRVLLGNMHTSKNASLLSEIGITHIVNCTSDLPNHFESPCSTAGVDVSYLRFDEIDIFSSRGAAAAAGSEAGTGTAAGTSVERRQPAAAEAGEAEDILLFFKPLFDFVDEAVDAGGNVLIHCVAGAHRAGTSMCAYLMHRDRTMSPDEAIACCKARRPIVDPAISPRLVNLLDRLYAAQTCAPIATAGHAGQAGQADAGTAPAIDLNAEGRKLLLERTGEELSAAEAAVELIKQGRTPHDACEAALKRLYT